MSWTRSLAFRVVAFSSIWAAVALIVIATVISTLFRQASERGFESLLSAHLFNLISSVGIADDGRIQGNPDLGDLRYTVPRSGWYWSVEPVSEGVTGGLRSLSLIGDVPAPSVVEVPFSIDYQRRYDAVGPAGEAVEVVESEFVLGTENRIARFRVTGNLSELEAEIDAFDRQLYFYLALFGLGTIAINAAAILFGLRPLGQVREALAKVREGTAQRLDGSFPQEIAPLADETNALIENNRRIVERSRVQVGNLAHSLKTPLAVLANEGDAIGGAKGALIREQASAMRHQVDHYLQRARIAAQRDSVVYRTALGPVLERMVRVIGKLQADKSIEMHLPPEPVVFAGEQEDFEEIVGNLLENAGKWGRSRIRVTLRATAPADPEMLAVVIEDDGPGIPEDRAREALKRGKRLDESKPGSGLGLSIVTDLVTEYGGSIVLATSDLGGLKAEISLRRAR